MKVVALALVGVLMSVTVACGGEEPTRRPPPPPQAAPAQEEYPPELKQFCDRFSREVGLLRAQGYSSDELFQALLDKGWTSEEIGHVSVICTIALE